MMYFLLERVTLFFTLCFMGLPTVSTRIKYSSADYKCENGVYRDMFDLTYATRASFYSPFLASLRKSQNYLSGSDIADAMEEYCRLAKKVENTVMSMMNYIGCLKQETPNFRSMIRKSHSFCLSPRSSVRTTTPSVLSPINFLIGPYMGVKPTGLMEGIGATGRGTYDKGGSLVQSSLDPRILQILEKLPTEHLDYRENPCYADAARKAYPCYRRYSRGVSRNNSDLAYSLKRLVFSMRCTYRQLTRKCTKERAFLLALLQYDWLIVPPALDVNIGYTILRTWRLPIAQRTND